MRSILLVGLFIAGTSSVSSGKTITKFAENSIARQGLPLGEGLSSFRLAPPTRKQTTIKYQNYCLYSSHQSLCDRNLNTNQLPKNFDWWSKPISWHSLPSRISLTALSLRLTDSEIFQGNNFTSLQLVENIFHQQRVYRNHQWQQVNSDERHKPLGSRSYPSQKVALKSTSNQSLTESAKFPKLNRSSLIVPLPNQDGSVCEVTTKEKCQEHKFKLAHPAPETERIASSFGWRRRPYSGQLQFHQGIDYGAPLGSPVVAAGDGIVTKVVSGCLDFRNRLCGNQLGNWVEIDHGNGAIAKYGHLLNRSIIVREGMTVRKSQEIAKVGSSGWSTGAHLDFRLQINGKHKDPADHIN